MSDDIDVRPRLFHGEFPVSQKFGNYWPEMYKTNGGRHNGTDYAVPVGTPLFAIFDGWVSRVERWQLTGYGRMVVLRSKCGHYEALYGHMSEISASVAPGDVVKLGDMLGASGNTGQSTGPHLHVSIWKDGVLIDPEVYLSQPTLFAPDYPSRDEYRTHVVVVGDTLSGLALKYLGAASRWPDIFSANKTVISDPSVVRPGQVLKIPGVVFVPGQRVSYTVQSGDTLSGLALKYLGAASRWPEIYELNRSVVPDPNMLYAGQRIVILIGKKND